MEVFIRPLFTFECSRKPTNKGFTASNNHSMCPL